MAPRCPGDGLTDAESIGLQSFQNIYFACSNCPTEKQICKKIQIEYANFFNFRKTDQKTGPPRKTMNIQNGLIWRPKTNGSSAASSDKETRELQPGPGDRKFPAFSAIAPCQVSMVVRLLLHYATLHYTTLHFTTLHCHYTLPTLKPA